MFGGGGGLLWCPSARKRQIEFFIELTGLQKLHVSTQQDREHLKAQVHKHKPSLFPTHSGIRSIFKSRISRLLLEKCRNENVRTWKEGALNPLRPFIVSASGRRAYNIRHTFFIWAFSRRAHHLAEPWPRVKQSSLLSNVLAGSHLKCVSNCEICTRKRREPSNPYHLEKKCRLCMFSWQY